jgi:hypothetical protein
MTGQGQFLNDLRADQAGAPDDHDPHFSSIR